MRPLRRRDRIVPHSRIGITAAALVAVAGGVQVARAQTWTRDAAGTFAWSDAANWSSRPISSPDAQLTFLGSTAQPYVANNDLAAPFRLNRLTLSTAAAAQITGNSLQFEASGSGVGPQVVQSGGNDFIIGSPLVLKADTTFAGGTAGGSLTLLGPISGTGALFLTGGLALNYGRAGGVTPDATFTGGATIDTAATLDLWSVGGASPTFGTGTITLHDGAALTVHAANNAAWTVPNAIRIDGNAAIRSASGGSVVLGGDVTLNGVLSGQPLSFAAGKQLRIDNTTTGLRAVYPGRGALAAQTLIAANIVDGAGGTANPLHLRAGVLDTIVSGTANTYTGGTFVEPNAYSPTSYVAVSAASSLGLGNVTVQDGARLRLGSAANLAPGRSVLVQVGGVIEFDANSMPFDNAAVALMDPASTGLLQLTASPAPDLNLSGHEQLLLGTLTAATVSTSYTPAAGGYRLVTQNNGQLSVYAADPNKPVLTGPYAFSAGLPGWNGTIYLNTPNDYTGGTTLNGGSLYAYSAGALGAGAVTLAGGAFYASADNTFGPAASLHVTGGAAYLSRANAYTNGTILDAGRLSVSQVAALGSGTVTISGGFLDTSVAIPNTIRLTGDATFEGQALPGAAALAGTLIVVGPRTISSRNDLAITGNIVRPAGDTGAGSPLHLNTTGVLRITGAANTYGGGTVIDGGNIVVNPGNSLGTGGVTVNAAALLDQFAINGITGAASGLAIVGGTARLYARNDYAGPTTVSAGGVLEAGADAALGTGPVTLSGGTLRAALGPRVLSNAVTMQPGSVIDLGSGDLTVAALTGGGTVTSTGTVTTAALSITGTLAVNNGTLAIQPAAPHVTHTAALLSVAPTARLDLGNGDLLTATPPATVRAYLAAGYHAGDWAGAGGITSSIALANPNQFSVGYADGNDPNNPRPEVSAGQTLLRPSLVGDMNLDGQVDFGDILQLLGGGKYNTGAAAGWIDGDLNYDGVTDFGDVLTLLGSGNYNGGLAFTSTSDVRFNDGARAIDLAVPEPTGLGTLGFGMIGLLARRRRRRVAP